MHDHNTSGRWMVWVMLICCVGPILLLSLGISLGISRGWIIGLIAVLILVHIWMMRRKKSDMTEADHIENGKSQNNHHSCH